MDDRRKRGGDDVALGDAGVGSEDEGETEPFDVDN